MPLVKIVFGQTDFALLDATLRAHSEGAPVIVMIHGYKFAPGHAIFCPFNDILSMTPRKRARAVSWPRHLGIGRSARGSEPLCIAFGWYSRGSIWHAWQRAQEAGQTLATLLKRIAASGAAPAGIVAHSLGARVALTAMQHAPARSIGRVVLLAGAEFRRSAHAAMAAPGGEMAEVMNITSGENLMYDRLIELAVGFGKTSLGRRSNDDLPRWVDLRIDDPASRDALANLGHNIGKPVQRICHWSGYLRPGLFALYRRWLGDSSDLPLTQLRAQLPRRTRRGWRALFRPFVNGVIDNAG